MGIVETTSSTTVAPEIEFDIGGRTYSVRPTLDIVKRLEQFGAPLALTRKLASLEVGIIDMSRLLFAVLRDQKNGPSNADQVADWLIEDGMQKATQNMGELLARLWGGNKRAREEALTRSGERIAGSTIN